jgi:hypothetical protein
MTDDSMTVNKLLTYLQEVKDKGGGDLPVMVDFTLHTSYSLCNMFGNITAAKVVAMAQMRYVTLKALDEAV